MKKIDAGQAITILANLGVIGGLIFVGLQLRQELDIAQANRVQVYSDSLRAWTELVVDNAELWTRGLGGESLSAEEETAFEAMARSRQNILYTQWRSANLTRQPRLADGIVREAAREFASHPGLLNFWRNRNAFMNSLGRSDGWSLALNAEIERLGAGTSAE